MVSTVIAAAVMVLQMPHWHTALALPPPGALVTHKLINTYNGTCISLLWRVLVCVEVGLLHHTLHELSPGAAATAAL